MADSTAAVWATVVPTVSAGRGSAGGFVGSAVALGFLVGRVEIRGAAATDFAAFGCVGTCPRHVGTLIDGSVLWRPRRFRHQLGPFFGFGAGYSRGAKAAALSVLAGGDQSLNRRLLVRLEAKYTEALTGTHVVDPGFPNPVTRTGARQFVVAVGIGVVGPFY